MFSDNANSYQWVWRCSHYLLNPMTNSIMSDIDTPRVFRQKMISDRLTKWYSTHLQTMQILILQTDNASAAIAGTRCHKAVIRTDTDVGQSCHQCVKSVHAKVLSPCNRVLFCAVDIHHNGVFKHGGHDLLSKKKMYKTMQVTYCIQAW